MRAVFRYNISAESPARSTLSREHGLSTGGGEHIYIDIVYDVLYALYDTLYVSRMIYGMLHVKYDDIDMLHIIYICESVYIYMSSIE